jgi:hypothetical protein
MPKQHNSTAAASRIAGVLNARFAAGRPSNHLEDVGVLLHVLDGTEHGAGQAWKPCEACPLANRLATSLVYKRMASRGPNHTIPVFANGIRGGFILRPQQARLRCAYPVDGGTRFKSDGCNGCLGKGCHADGWCTPYNVSSLVPSFLWKTQRVHESTSGHHSHRSVVLGNSTDECAWPQARWQAARHAAWCGRKAWPPSELTTMLLTLQQLAVNVGPCGPAFGQWSDPNIELIINTTHWPVPAIVEAFFYPVSSKGVCCEPHELNGTTRCIRGCQAQVQTLHDHFSELFGRNSAPMVEFHFDDWDAPFVAPSSLL